MKFNEKNEIELQILSKLFHLMNIKLKTKQKIEYNDCV
jgi:hypothetical protein